MAAGLHSTGLQQFDDLSVRGLKTCGLCFPWFQMHVELKAKLERKKIKGQGNSLGFTQCPDFENLAQGACRVQVPSGPSGNAVCWPGGRTDLCGLWVPQGPH